MDFHTKNAKAEELGGWWDNHAEVFRFPSRSSERQFQKWLAEHGDE